MSALNDLKKRLHIYYTDAAKDAELQSYIDEAKAYLSAAGAQSYHLTDGAETPLALGAIALYVKMAQGSDPAQMRQNPVLLSMISQMKYSAAEESEG